MSKMAARDSGDKFEVDLADEGGLAEVNSLLKNVYDILKRDTLILRKEKEAFDAVAQKLEHVHFSKTLKLNIGGQFFTTSLETMKKDPGSMLHAMFSGRFDSKPAEDGSYFIDRDGTHFRHILNYLRTGELVVPEDKIVRRELLIEAGFYQVQGIIDELKSLPFEDSIILSKEQRQTLSTWLPDTLCHNYSLIYRASINGWAAANFHSCCDRKGPTVTVVKSGNNIFGGYTEHPWESHSSGAYKKAPDSFLFSLVNPYGLQPTKMPLIPGKEDYAILWHSSYGPTFGGGNDLRMVNAPNANACYTTLNNTYQLPAGQNTNAFLTGSQTFTISEMEVFKFEK